MGGGNMNEQQIKMEEDAREITFVLASFEKCIAITSVNTKVQPTDIVN